MMIITVLLGIVAAVYGFTAIEKKRRPDGVLEYPLWRCNLILAWLAASLLSALLIGGVGLPKFVGIVMHGQTLQASITALSREEHCKVTYAYKVNDKPYTGSDTHCGLKPGDTHDVFYDTLAPENATLYHPKDALEDEIAAIGIISVVLGGLVVVWFRGTHIIGPKKKS